MPTELECLLNGHLSRKTLPKHSTDVLIDEFRQVHSTPYRAKPKGRQLSAVEISRMPAECFIDLVATEWVVSIVLFTKKGDPCNSASTIIA